jgi:hypothetical protein
MTDGTRIRSFAGFFSVKLQKVVSMDEQTNWLMVATHFGSLGALPQLNPVVWHISIIFVCNDTFWRHANIHRVVYWTKLESHPIYTIHAMFCLGSICRVCVANSTVLEHLLKPC